MKEQTKKRKATGWVRAGAIALVGLAVIAGVLLWARSNSGATGTPSSATTTQSGTMMQTNEGGQITIKVTWRRNAGPVFSVEMDTHVVNLDGYDLRQLAVLRTGQGQEQLTIDRLFVGAIMAGFGTQVGLYTYLGGMHLHATAGGVAASTGTSTVAMLATVSPRRVVPPLYPSSTTRQKRAAWLYSARNRRTVCQDIYAGTPRDGSGFAGMVLDVELASPA